MSTPPLQKIMGVIYVIYHRYYHGIRVRGFTQARSGHNVVIIIIIIGVYCRQNSHIIAQKHTHTKKKQNKETNTQTAYTK